jgi:hypothetical protein
MDVRQHSDTFGCGGSCETCGYDAATKGPAGPAPFEGWRLARMCLFFFLVPLLAGAAGALLARDNPTGQLLWGVGGLALGMLATSLVARRFGRSAEENR